MNKVLFVSPTVYSNPLTKDIQKKFQSLSNVCNPIVYAFSEEKFTSSVEGVEAIFCLLYTSPSPRDRQKSRMPSSA